MILAELLDDDGARTASIGACVRALSEQAVESTTSPAATVIMHDDDALRVRSY